MGSQGLNFGKARVLIVGDVMLDQYWHGSTSRISPEAPVPVVHVKHIDERPGGAANVALGVAALGAKPYLLGFVGNDHAAFTLEQLLLKKEIQYQFDKIPDYTTVTKLRVLSHNQQMIRLDMEKSFSDPFKATVSLVGNYERLLQDINMVILSDYGKGTLSNSVNLIAKARERGIPVIVDPKSLDFSVYRGASVLTPNLKEFEAVVGRCENVEILVKKARQILTQYDIEALVVTRSEYGLSIILTSGEVMHVPALAREVHDVTGAGDTVIAVLASAIASGMNVIEAATLGNIAAGIVVGKLGAESVSVDELELALNKEQNLPLGIMDEETLLDAIQISKMRGERIVFTNGCFDILHSGHVMYLEQAKCLGDRIVVAVNDDASVARLKGYNRPINTLEDRMHVLAGLRVVDWVVPFQDDTPERIIRRICPHVLVKGGDYQDINVLPGVQFVLSQGGEVQILGLKEGRSTTQILKTMIAQRSGVADLTTD